MGGLLNIGRMGLWINIPKEIWKYLYRIKIPPCSYDISIVILHFVISAAFFFPSRNCIWSWNSWAVEAWTTCLACGASYVSRRRQYRGKQWKTHMYLHKTLAYVIWFDHSWSYVVNSVVWFLYVPIIPIVPIVPILCFINVETLVSSLEASDVFRQIAEGLHYIHMRQGTVPNTCAKAIGCMEVCFCSWFLANTVSFCLFATYRFVGGFNPVRRSQEYGEGITSCSYLLNWP